MPKRAPTGPRLSPQELVATLEGLIQQTSEMVCSLRRLSEDCGAQGEDSVRTNWSNVVHNGVVVPMCILLDKIRIVLVAHQSDYPPLQATLESFLQRAIVHEAGPRIVRDAPGAIRDMERIIGFLTSARDVVAPRQRGDVENNGSSSFRQRLEQELKHRGWSPGIWAREAHVDRSTAYRYFNGERALQASTAKALATAIGIDPKDFPERLEPVKRTSRAK